MTDYLTNISPIDGRYKNIVKPLSNYFSEYALMRCRLIIEVEYFIFLSLEKNIHEVNPFSANKKKYLRLIYKNFSLKDAQTVKEIEKKTNHDVKAIEYFLKQKIEQTLRPSSGQAELAKYVEFIHFALTSEDINNIAYALMWKGAIKNIYLPTIEELQKKFFTFANKWKNQPMLSLTHGQSATPTTVGKEFAVFFSRIQRQLNILKKHKLQGKFSGTTGTWGAHLVAYPNVDWINFSKKFISFFNLEPNLLTTQIESHDSLIESFNIIQRINNILIDFTQDTWMYISRGILCQTKKDGEVGSSTMPHKINPIQFEGAEGNLGIANSFFQHFSQKLPISRMQRDLSDSTVMRNIGVPLAHSILAYKNILEGLSRLSVDTNKLNEELNNHWEVLAEPIQTVLRRVGHEKPYEKLKELTRGKKIDEKNIHDFINSLEIPINEKVVLLKLTPQNYIGLAKKIVDLLC